MSVEYDQNLLPELVQLNEQIDENRIDTLIKKTGKFISS